MIDLSPLPNSLIAFTHTYFAGRGSLSFLTKEALTFRLQKSADGFGVVLTETANTPGGRGRRCRASRSSLVVGRPARSSSARTSWCASR